MWGLHSWFRQHAHLTTALTPRQSVFINITSLMTSPYLLLVTGSLRSNQSRAKCTAQVGMSYRLQGRHDDNPPNRNVASDFILKWFNSRTWWRRHLLFILRAFSVFSCCVASDERHICMIIGLNNGLPQNKRQYTYAHTCTHTYHTYIHNFKIWKWVNTRTYTSHEKLKMSYTVLKIYP